MRRFLRILSKVLYALPLLVCAGIGLILVLGICLIGMFLSGWAGDAMDSLIQSPEWIGVMVLVMLPVLLPLAGSILLMCRKWWGFLFGVIYGAALAVLGSSTMLQSIMQEETILYLGLGIVIYYGAMGMLCVWLEMGRNDSPETPAGVE